MIGPCTTKKHGLQSTCLISCTSEQNFELKNTLIFKTLGEFKVLTCMPSVDNQNINEGENEVERICPVELNLVN